MFNRLAEKMVKEHVKTVDRGSFGKDTYEFMNDNLGDKILIKETSVPINLKLPLGVNKKAYIKMETKQLKVPGMVYPMLIDMVNGKDSLETINKTKEKINTLINETDNEIKKDFLRKDIEYLDRTFVDIHTEHSDKLAKMMGVNTKLIGYERNSIFSGVGVYIFADNLTEAKLVRITTMFVVNSKDDIVIGETNTIDLDYGFIKEISNEN